MTLRILHFSDPHFTRIILNPNQFLSKQWLGNLNYTLFRRGAYKTHHLSQLPSLATQLGVDWVIASGDFTSTSDAKEYEMALSFMKTFKQPYLALPGNHDVYTKQAELQQRYYNYFPSCQMQKDYVQLHQLKKGWWWIGLDCARANNLLNSNGIFRQEMDESLSKAILSVPKNERIIVGNHFPLYAHGRVRHDTVRATILQEILKAHQNVRLYLHGHDHNPYIINPTEDGNPLVLNPGSIALAPKSAFYLIDLEADSCSVKRYSRTEDDWAIDLEREFNW